MEFNRQSIANLQKIKHLAREEQGYIIHYDSATLEHDLRTLVRSGVSFELLTLIEKFLPTQEPLPVLTTKPRMYRGIACMVDDSTKVAKRTQKIYRGQIVME